MGIARVSAGAILGNKRRELEQYILRKGHVWQRDPRLPVPWSAFECVSLYWAYLDGLDDPEGWIPNLDDLELHATWTGTPGLLVEALTATRWIERHGKRWKWHDYETWNSKAITARRNGRAGGRPKGHGSQPPRGPDDTESEPGGDPDNNQAATHDETQSETQSRTHNKPTLHPTTEPKSKQSGSGSGSEGMEKCCVSAGAGARATPGTHTCRSAPPDPDPDPDPDSERHPASDGPRRTPRPPFAGVPPDARDAFAAWLAAGLHAAAGGREDMAATVAVELVARVEGDMGFLTRYARANTPERFANLPRWADLAAKAWVEQRDAERLAASQAANARRLAEVAEQDRLRAEFETSGYTDAAAWRVDRKAGHLRTGEAAARRRWDITRGVHDVEETPRVVGCSTSSSARGLTCRRPRSTRAAAESPP